MAATTHAVFLSYASQDAEAARRIAEALRAFGVEVWFDQEELRGGDAWDAKIRRQIHACALFMPVISQHTQERAEGYFRREWHLAVERSHDLAEGAPFLVPVVIDTTRDADAVVPEAFLRVQWMCLPQGAPTAQYIEHVKRLLAAPHCPRPPARSAGVSARTACARSRPPLAAAIVVILLVLVTGLFWWWRRRELPPAASGDARPTAAEDAVPVVHDKSIAVLPFANMSEDAAANAFFADGMHEDVLTNLALVRDLRVVSRTTALQYRDTKKPLKTIGAELGVAYILEGSVRRAGSRVRVTGQLIDARTDEHLWAKSYDRDLTDVFAIQSELAQAIALALQAAISPQEKSTLARAPTASVEAYDLLLKARNLPWTDVGFRARYEKQVDLLQAAVALDPSFAIAWAELAEKHASIYFHNYDHSQDRRAKAKQATDTAVRLAPDSPDVIRSRGICFLYADREYAQATAQFERLERLRPNDADVLVPLCDSLLFQARWTEALATARRATQLDQRNIGHAWKYYEILVAARRWAEATAEGRRVLEMEPDHTDMEGALAWLTFAATGSMRDVESLLARKPPVWAESPKGIVARKWWAIQSCNATEAMRLERQFPVEPGNLPDEWRYVIGTAMALLMHGDAESAKSLLLPRRTVYLERLEREPQNTDALWTLGLIEGLLGHKEEALRLVEQAVALIPSDLDAVNGPIAKNRLALVYAWTGEGERAIAEATRMLQAPYGGTTVPIMRHDPWWWPLRQDPRFLALLDDPKNNAPLF